jgi:hypothetical protein
MDTAKQRPQTAKHMSEIEHYNLDMIISLGYRVKSKIAAKFRIRATAGLCEYIVKGFTIDSDKPFPGLTRG